MAAKKKKANGKHDPHNETMRGAVKKVAPLLAKLPADGRPTRAQLEAFVAGAPSTLEAVLAEREDQVNALDLAFVMVAARAVKKAKPTVHGRDGEIDEALVIRGDFHVKGNLTFDGDVYILGDLVVDGVLSEYRHTRSLVVGGQVRARGIKCGGRIYSGKGIRADVVFLELGGKLGGPGGVSVDLAILEPGTAVSGKLTAKTKVALTIGANKPLAKLQATLAPSAFATLPGHDNVFDYSALMDALANGEPWRAKPGAANAPTAKVGKPRRAANSKKPPRYFECRGGGASKFWEIRVDGTSFTTWYGRIGTKGQTSTKSFKGPFEAEYNADLLVREKKKKGYKEKPKPS